MKLIDCEKFNRKHQPDWNGVTDLFDSDFGDGFGGKVASFDMRVWWEVNLWDR